VAPARGRLQDVQTADIDMGKQPVYDPRLPGRIEIAG
jgi:hypothetical protein